MAELLFLLLLDLTAAFDTADHMVLIKHLKHWVGISDTVLVHKVSVLDPLMFLISILPLGQIVSIPSV